MLIIWLQQSITALLATGINPKKKMFCLKSIKLWSPSFIQQPLYLNPHSPGLPAEMLLLAKTQRNTENEESGNDSSISKLILQNIMFNHHAWKKQTDTCAYVLSRLASSYSHWLKNFVNTKTLILSGQIINRPWNNHRHLNWFIKKYKHWCLSIIENIDSILLWIKQNICETKHSALVQNSGISYSISVELALIVTSFLNRTT